MLPRVDSKLEKLIEELMRLYPTLQGRNGVIVFTVYADTAKYLYEHLRNRFKAYNHGDGGRTLLLVTGRGARRPLENTSKRRRRSNNSRRVAESW
jgi:hypothetical protein